MKESIKNFLKFNGQTLLFLEKDGTYWIAIKPICDAIGLHHRRQLSSIKEDKILGAVYANQPMQVPGNQVRLMAALPEFYIYGWLFGIQSRKPALQEYKWECYKVLHNYFKNTITQRDEILRIKSIAMQKAMRIEEC